VLFLSLRPSRIRDYARIMPGLCQERVVPQLEAVPHSEPYADERILAALADVTCPPKPWDERDIVHSHIQTQPRPRQTCDDERWVAAIPAGRCAAP